MTTSTPVMSVDVPIGGWTPQPMTAYSVENVMTPAAGGGYGIGLPLMREEVDSFLTRNPGVDSEADRLLRLCSKDVQRAVISKGPLEGREGPSAVLVQRISEANMRFQTIQIGGGEAPTFLDVDKYLSEAPVDPHAAKRFRELPANIQQQVMIRKSLKTSRNPSKLLLGLIADVTRLPIEMEGVAAAQAAKLKKVKPHQPEQDDDIDAVLKQIQEEEKSKGAKKRKASGPSGDVQDKVPGLSLGTSVPSAPFRTMPQAPPPDISTYVPRRENLTATPVSNKKPPPPPRPAAEAQNQQPSRVSQDSSKKARTRAEELSDEVAQAFTQLRSMTGGENDEAYEESTFASI